MSKKVVEIGRVVSVDDEYGAGRIKVKLMSADEDKRVTGNTEEEKIEQLKWCYPLLSTLIHVMPKVGEAVLVILASAGETDTFRYWVGPIISQPNFTPKCEYNRALALFPGTTTKEQDPISIYPVSYGAVPDSEDIAIMGRDNTDIILSDRSLKLRCGSRNVDTDGSTGEGSHSVKFNKARDSAFIELDYPKNDFTTIPEYTYSFEGGGGPQYSDAIVQQRSTITLAADQINILGNYGNIGDGISMDEINSTGDLVNGKQKTITEKCHPVVFGDKLIAFLKTFMDMFKEHTHKYPGLPTILASGHETFWNYDLNSFISKNIRIN